MCVWGYNHFHCFPTPTLRRSHLAYILATTHTNTDYPTPWCPGLPQLVERGHSLGEAQSFLHLAVNVVYSVSAAWWEVHGGRSEQHVGSLSRSTVLPCEKCPCRRFLMSYAHMQLQILCIYTHIKHTHSVWQAGKQSFNLYALYFKHWSDSTVQRELVLHRRTV